MNASCVLGLIPKFSGEVPTLLANYIRAIVKEKPRLLVVIKLSIQLPGTNPELQNHDPSEEDELYQRAQVACDLLVTYVSGDEEDGKEQKSREKLERQ